MVLKINVNTTITMITWSDWPADSVCNEMGKQGSAVIGGQIDISGP